MNREGLGSQAIDSDNITREQAEEIVRNYAASNRVDDLVFASELNFDERKEIRMLAKRYGLAERMAVQPAGRVCNASHDIFRVLYWHDMTIFYRLRFNNYRNFLGFMLFIDHSRKFEA
jgi:hypothetical protein